jgi:hypothetical protein
LIAGFEVLTAMLMNCSVFWAILLCSSLKVNQRSGRKFEPHIEDLRLYRARNKCSACNFLHAGFLLVIFFDPKDGNGVLL